MLLNTGIISRTFTFMLAGGNGTRLHPLTFNRPKPLVPFGGIFRIVDFTLSNCVNSNLKYVYLLTQHKHASLDRFRNDPRPPAFECQPSHDGVLDRKKPEQHDVGHNRLNGGDRRSIIDRFRDDHAGDKTNLIKKGSQEDDVAKQAKR